MFNKLRERIRTKQAYINAPATFEVLGVQGDTNNVQWFRRNFKHRSLEAMFWLYVAYGLILGSVTGIIVSSGEVTDGTIVGFTLGLVFLISLLMLKHESKKVA